MNPLLAKLNDLDSLQSRISAVRPFPPNTLLSLRDKLSLEWTYHSNAIEGNTLTLNETKVVLEGVTVGGKSIREHVEATNHDYAIRFVEDIVSNREPITEWMIKNIHSIVLKGIDDSAAGRYRQENVVIAGASTTPPDFLHLNEEMRDLITWYDGAVQNKLHPVARAAELHTRFVKIHPFVDGNGRTGRLLLNLDLMKDGFPPAVIRKQDRLEYYDSLDVACVRGDFERITDLVADAVIRSQEIYLNLLTSKPRPQTNNNSNDFTI